MTANTQAGVSGAQTSRMQSPPFEFVGGTFRWPNAKLINAGIQTDPQPITVNASTQTASDQHVDAVPANFKSVTRLDRLLPFVCVLGGFVVFMIGLGCLYNFQNLSPHTHILAS